MEKHIVEESTGVTQPGDLPAPASLTRVSSDVGGNVPPAFKEHLLWGQEQSQPERSWGGGGDASHSHRWTPRWAFFFLTETLVSQCLGPTRGSEPGDRTPSGWSACGGGPGVDEGSACLWFGDHIPPGKERRGEKTHIQRPVTRMVSRIQILKHMGLQ